MRFKGASQIALTVLSLLKGSNTSRGELASYTDEIKMLIDSDVLVQSELGRIVDGDDVKKLDTLGLLDKIAKFIITI